MTKQLQTFENKEFGKVRAVEIDGQPWFVGADVTKKLGYRNSRDALSKHVDDEDKGVANCDTLRGKQNLTVISESGLYSLMFSSKLETAKSFRRWVTAEILPAIRVHGAYITDETLRRLREDGGFKDELLQKIADERAEKTALAEKVEQLAPKIRYYDAILQCDNAVQVSIIAKDYGMSAVAFNKLLNGFRVQYKMGGTWLLYEKHANQGYTVTRTYHVNDTTSTIHTYWTQRGRWFLYDLLRWYGILPCSEKPGGALIGGEDYLC
ncbi:MAG: phage antirepressor KilAC domain-containing protein [Oscillospiraceae bacterium]|nr:phage antirepressor KilAC domain-containing protein [Oscillospiraceae bacterium]